jgi:hypothetical protein
MPRQEQIVSLIKARAVRHQKQCNRCSGTRMNQLSFSLMPQQWIMSVDERPSKSPCVQLRVAKEEFAGRAKPTLWDHAQSLMQR